MRKREREKVISSIAESSVQELAPAQLVLLTLQALLCTLHPDANQETASEGAMRGRWLLVRAGNAMTVPANGCF